MKVGIIGFGRLGELLTGYLSQDSTVYVYDKKEKSQAIKDAGGIPASLKEVCQSPLVLPMVPISSFESVILEIKDLLEPETLVIDVCSV